VKKASSEGAVRYQFGFVESFFDRNAAFFGNETAMMIVSYPF
jgi:hypothetical protein